MGLFKKVKEILFDEEEYTEKIKITPEMRNEDVTNNKEIIKEKTQEIPKPVTPVKVESYPKEPEKEAPKKDTNFPFFDFDEEEFDQQKPVKNFEPVREMPKRSTNVLEYERKKKIEKRMDYGRYEKTEITETVERRKFKPSPIISPVYGILNQDYNKEDILSKRNPDKVDIQSVRDKAFGEKKVYEKETPKTTFYEETETVTISEPEEKEKKVKTIDELLEDTSDLVVDIDSDLEAELNDIEEEIEEKKELSDTKTNIKIPQVEDTLESDLFDLIDSMYDNKEEGE